MLRLAERDDLNHGRTTTAQLAQALSELGQVIAGQHTTSDIVARIADPGVPPPALLNRAARYLEAATEMVRGEGVLPDGFDAARATQRADTLEADAVAVRYYSDGA